MCVDPLVAQLLDEELDLVDGDGAGVEVGVVGDAEGGCSVYRYPYTVIMETDIDNIVSHSVECRKAFVVIFELTLVTCLLREVML